MNEQTMIIPAITAGTTVYTTRSARVRTRVYSVVNHVRAHLARRITRLTQEGFVPLLAHNMAEDLREKRDWILDKAEPVLLWWDRLRTAQRYSRSSARHKRRVFATDSVAWKLKRERYVSAATPVAQRTYPQDEHTGGFTVFSQKMRWEEETQEIARRMRREQKNAQLVLAGAEGPLER